MAHELTTPDTRPVAEAAPDRTAPPVKVAMVTLGCARNEVDSEELAARLEAGGFELTDDADAADAVMVNTCGFVEQAKKDSVDALLAAADLRGDDRASKAVVAVGCMAERYGASLAEELPEADAVLGFDSYGDIAATLQGILDGHAPAPHVPRDRRELLPLSPVDRAGAAGSVTVPGHGTVSEPDLPAGLAPASGPRTVRRRLGSGPGAPLKIASGCDRRCAFCAIPSFRGAFLSRRPTDVIDEARWLTSQGVRELFLVSENSTSYGKDLGDLRLLESLLPELAALPDAPWVRVSYLQPAEMRPTLIDVMTSTEGVLPYFDLSFQHASGPLLRRMRRFGDADRFLQLLESIRHKAPSAGIRSNVIVGFPGETEEDLGILTDFLTRARLDVVGVFGYSDEDGTEAEGLGGKLDDDEILHRVEVVQDLVDELMAQRAEDRIGENVSVLIEQVEDGVAEGRAVHQGPDVDGTTRVVGLTSTVTVGAIVQAVVVSSDGVDLVAEANG